MRNVLDRVVGYALGVCLAVMTCVIFVNVIYRYILNQPFTWAEELASLLFAWLTFVGAYVGFRTRSHIAIDTLVVFLPEAVRRPIRWVVDLGCLCLLAIFIWQGFNLALTTWSLEYPAMEISRGYLYLSLPVGGCLMALAILLGWRGAGAPAEPETSR